MQHLEVDLAVLKDLVAVNDESHRDVLFIVPADFVVFDDCFFRAASVLGRGGGWEVPFYVGSTGDEGDVVEVNDLHTLISLGVSLPARGCTFNPRSNFGYVVVSTEAGFLEWLLRTLRFLGTRN